MFWSFCHGAWSKGRGDMVSGSLKLREGDFFNALHLHQPAQIKEQASEEDSGEPAQVNGVTSEEMRERTSR